MPPVERRSAFGAKRSTAGRRPHDGVPGIRSALAVEDRARQRLFPLWSTPKFPRAPRPAPGAIHRKGQSLPFRGRLSAHALRRHEKRVAIARALAWSRHAADGRAVRRPRRADPAQDAGRASVAVGRCGFTVMFVTHSIEEAICRHPHPGAVAASRTGKAELDAGHIGFADLGSRPFDVTPKRIHELLFADDTGHAKTAEDASA